MNVWLVRPERDGDEAAIARTITRAFAAADMSSGAEANIVRRLRDDAELDVSMVAVSGAGQIVGHIALSRVTIDGADCGWYGLGPLAVDPEWQRRGIGSALVRAGLDSLGDVDASGCVVLGEPEYYGRFGFVHDPALRYPGSPPQVFQRLVLRGTPPSGVVSYPAAFG